MYGHVLQQTSFALRVVVTPCFGASCKQPLGKFLIKDKGG